MRDITAKVKSLRIATARATIKAQPETIEKVKNADLPKGDALAVAKVAAVQAAKNTSLLIPYCHPIPVEAVNVGFKCASDSIECTVEVKTIYKTGVEMEALSAASAAVLTIYDMAKMIDETMIITETILLEKTGGKSDFKQPFASKLSTAVVVMSDTISAGKKQDRSGQIIVDRLTAEELTVKHYTIIPDNPDEIEALVLNYCDNEQLDLIITTGGTGVSPRDRTPEAILKLINLELPGAAEAIRAYGQERTPYAMLSRCFVGVRGKTLIICLPGSTGGVQDALDAIFPSILHAYKMLWGGTHATNENKNRESILVS